MNTGRLIVVLDTTPNLRSREMFADLCQQLLMLKKPTFACGLVADVTLALTCKWPQVIYNAFEFFDLADPGIYQMAHFSEVYLVASGAVWQHSTPLSVADSPVTPGLSAPAPAPALRRGQPGRCEK